MSLLASMGEFFENGQVGDWAFDGDSGELWLAINLHKGEHGLAILPIYQGARPNNDHAWWLWNGDKESPTLSPSILHHGYDGAADWHGYLRAGKLEVV